MNKIELLAPAGSLEKLKFAIEYGADAVYIGGEIFGLRASARNFSFEQMKEGVEFAHNKGKKVYLTLNIIPHNEDLDELENYLVTIKELNIDAVILSDPGTLMFVKKHLPDMEIHLSTQANNTNYMSCNFWYEQGIKRVILARELSFEEMARIRENIPSDLELEAFIHGAMCISYSGRCLLSNYMNGRDSNRGACAHPCRWEYYLMEKTREGEYYKIVEDDKGTFIFNSKDLCMIEHIPELINSGLNSLKIEGRMKSAYYVANIVRAYRKAIDDYYDNPKGYKFDPNLLDEIKKASHREFTKGFYYNKANENDQLYGSSSYTRDYDFVGLVLEYDESKKLAKVEQRNKFSVGDEIEIMGPNYYNDKFIVSDIFDKNMEAKESAPHAQQIIYVKIDKEVKPNYILRKRKDV